MKSFLRQEDIFVPDDDAKVVIIGAGGIGSWTALALSKTGFKSIEVWDNDIVEPHNIPSQAFSLSGVSKALELEKNLENVTSVNRLWDGDRLESDIVVVAVDNMDTRKRIVESLSGTVPLIIDGRIGGELIRVLSVSFLDVGSLKYYMNSWYPSSESVKLPCTAMAIADIGFFVAAFISNLIRKFLKDGVITREIVFDANGLELLKIEKT